MAELIYVANVSLELLDDRQLSDGVVYLRYGRPDLSVQPRPRNAGGTHVGLAP